MTIDIPEQCTLELDADSLVYRVAGAIDIMEQGVSQAMSLLDSQIDKMYEDCKCNKINIYLGSDTNYRNQFATLAPYKGNRENSNRPMFYGAIRERLFNHYSAILVEYQEAEDAVGIAATAHKKYSDYIIGAIDKDMKMIPGNHYNYATRKKYFISEIEAMRNFYTQLLTGDSTDNIPGCYKLLLLNEMYDQAHTFRYSKYKTKLIEKLDSCVTELEMYETVFSVYKELFTPIYALNSVTEIGRLLWIRRYAGELWCPPTERKLSYLDFKKEM